MEMFKMAPHTNEAMGEMDDSDRKLKELFEKIEADQKPIDERSLADQIRKLHPPDKQGRSPADDPLAAEFIAFSFSEDYADKSGGWGTYYGPMLVFQDKGGEVKEFPSIQQVTSEVLGYWSSRFGEAKHPALKVRYADLVWDFSKPVLGQNADISAAHALIDQTSELVAINLEEHPIPTIAKLRRALSVSLSINDAARTKAVAKAMMGYEERIAEDGKPGLWGFSFEELVENKKVGLSQQENEKIVRQLEERLSRVSTTDGAQFNQFAVEKAATLLARHYEREGSKESKERVLRAYGNAFLQASEGASPLVGSSWLQSVYQVYRGNGMKQDAECVAIKLQELEQRAVGEMKTISTEISIPNAEMDRFVEEMTRGTLAEALRRIAGGFIPPKEKVKDQVLRIAKEAPLQALIGISIMDHTGRTVAKIGSVEADIEGRVIHQMSQNIQFDAIFLEGVLAKLIDGGFLARDSLLNHLMECPLFVPERKGLFEHGLKAYFEGDYVSFISIAIPEIENALRQILALNNVPLYRPHRSGGFTLRNLEDILHEQAVLDTFKEDIITYLRVTLSDQRGMNLRNRVCHGLLPFDLYEKRTANLLLHILLVLALVRLNKPKSENR